MFAALVNGQSDYFGNWPAGSSPKEIGKRLAENFVKRDFENAVLHYQKMLEVDSSHLHALWMLSALSAGEYEPV